MHKTGKTTLNPYLTFPGNCKEAMEFYKNALNGQLETLPFEGNPVEVPEEYKQKIMHATLTFGDAILMASDGMPGQQVKFGNSTSLSIAAGDLKEAERIFKALSENGHIIMPFEKTFWGAEFGMCTDKYGIGWMVGFENEG